MNNKVEELVEWVAKQIGLTLYKSDNWEEYPEKSKRLFRIGAKQILSHPDLALIDRDIKPPSLSINDCERINKLFRKDTKAKIIKAYYDAQIELINEHNYEPIIPLAEALKGANNG